MHLTDIPPALPLWRDGHAYLTVTPAFLDVRNPRSGEVLRRIPLCAADEAHKALASAQAALAAAAMAGGSTVVVRPAPQAPSALLALAELASSCALPPGVLNIVHGDEDVVEDLWAVCGLSVVPV